MDRHQSSALNAPGSGGPVESRRRDGQAGQAWRHPARYLLALAVLAWPAWPATGAITVRADMRPHPAAAPAPTPLPGQIRASVVKVKGQYAWLSLLDDGDVRVGCQVEFYSDATLGEPVAAGTVRSLDGATIQVKIQSSKLPLREGMAAVIRPLE